jgi:GT2 family glycosyltransferase
MEGKTEIDIIILSSGQNNGLRTITENCIDSLMLSESPHQISFNILVIESQKDLMPFQYPNATTIYPEEDFSCNKYLNIGIEASSSKYVCLCNNDLIFHPRWATELLRAFDKNPDLSSASPVCSLHHPGIGYKLNSGLYTGYRSNYELAGWCKFLKRDAFRIIGKLDENYKFWCADNDYGNSLNVLRLRHALVSSSVVDHLESAAYNSPAEEESDQITDSEFFYFEKKWNYRTVSQEWKEIKMEI